VSDPRDALMLKVPPHSTEAEQSLIGALLLSNDAYDRVAWLQPTAFYADSHRLLWQAIRKMIEAGRPADVVTVAQALQDSGELDRVGGPAYLGSLAQNTPSALNIHRYAELVRDKAILRNLIAQSQKIAEDCFTGAEEPRAIAERAEALVLSVLDDEMAGDVDLPRLLMETVDRADEARKTSKPRALGTGYADLDERLGGLAPGYLAIIAARPSIGKTALALNIAEQVSAHQFVAFFSLEMTREEIAHRLLSGRASVPLHQFRSGRLTLDQVNELAAQATEAGQRKLLLDDRPHVGVGYLLARCRRWKRKHGLSLVIVDYLQLMSGKGDTREQEVSSISRGLKALAKELHVPVIALCQLNRALEVRPDKRPYLYDLRESGAIEQDADVVLMLYRDDVHGDDTPNVGLAQVLIRKNRNGQTGEVTLRYMSEYCRFENTADRFVVDARAPRPVVGFRVGSLPADGKMRAAGD